MATDTIYFQDQVQTVETFRKLSAAEKIVAIHQARIAYNSYESRLYASTLQGKVSQATSDEEREKVFEQEARSLRRRGLFHDLPENPQGPRIAPAVGSREWEKANEEKKTAFYDSLRQKGYSEGEILWIALRNRAGEVFTPGGEFDQIMGAMSPVLMAGQVQSGPRLSTANVPGIVLPLESAPVGEVAPPVEPILPSEIPSESPEPPGMGENAALEPSILPPEGPSLPELPRGNSEQEVPPTKCEAPVAPLGAEGVLRTRSLRQIRTLVDQGSLNVSQETLATLRALEQNPYHYVTRAGQRISQQRIEVAAADLHATLPRMAELQRAAQVEFALIEQEGRYFLIRGLPEEVYFGTRATRVIAHTQPGPPGFMALRPSLDDLANLPVGQNTSIIIGADGRWIQFSRTGPRTIVGGGHFDTLSPLIQP